MESFSPFRRSRTVSPRISPLASWDRTNEALALATSGEFTLKPHEHRHVLGRELSLAIASAGGKIRIIRGQLARQHSGGRWTLMDADGFNVAAIDPAQIVGWSTASTDELERATVKALQALRTASREAFVAAHYAMAA